MRTHAGNPESMSEAMEDFAAMLEGGQGESSVVSLNDPRRDAAWAELAGG